MNAASTDRRGRTLLLLGVVVGVGAAAWGLLRSGRGETTLPDGMAALVNGEPITAEAFLQLEASVNTERRGAALDASQRQRILDRLIDEELLLQRGLALGLARHEPAARRAILSAVVATVTSEAEAEEPEEETLRRFHAEAAERFQQPARVVVEAVFASAAIRPEAEAAQRAADATRRLRAGEAIETVGADLGDRLVAPLPAGPLPIDTLRQYLGPSPADAAALLSPGEVSEPVRGGSGYYVLRLRERTGGAATPFETVKDQVRAEWLRAQGERALGDYIEQLREQGTVLERLPDAAAKTPAP